MTANINPKTNIRYGVINGYNAPWLLEAIYDHGENETFKAHQEECIKIISKALEECGQINPDETAKDIVSNFEWDHYEEDCDSYSYKDEEGNEFLLSFLGGAPLIWCIHTTCITYVKSLCSPCVPNAGDLDSGFDPHGYECYGIPPSYIEEEEA